VFAVDQARLLESDDDWTIEECAELYRADVHCHPQYKRLCERKFHAAMRRMLIMWGPAERPLSFFQNHTLCVRCRRFFATDDDGDKCRVAGEACDFHAHSRAVDRFVAYAVFKRYGQSVTLFVPGEAKAPDRAVLVKPPKPIAEEWTLVDSDSEDEEEQLSDDDEHERIKAAVAEQLSSASSNAAPSVSDALDGDMEAVLVRPPSSAPLPSLVDAVAQMPQVPSLDAVDNLAALVALPHPPREAPLVQPPPSYFAALNS
jgi:hypothetical protein